MNKDAEGKLRLTYKVALENYKLAYFSQKPTEPALLSTGSLSIAISWGVAPDPTVGGRGAILRRFCASIWRVVTGSIQVGCSESYSSLDRSLLGE